MNLPHLSKMILQKAIYVELATFRQNKLCYDCCQFFDLWKNSNFIYAFGITEREDHLNELWRSKWFTINLFNITDQSTIITHHLLWWGSQSFNPILFKIWLEIRFSQSDRNWRFKLIFTIWTAALYSMHFFVSQIANSMKALSCRYLKSVTLVARRVTPDSIDQEVEVHRTPYHVHVHRTPYVMNM